MLHLHENMHLMPYPGSGKTVHHHCSVFMQSKQEPVLQELTTM